MFFKVFGKLTKVKILVDTVKASWVNLVFRLKLAKVIMKKKDLFYQLIVTHVSKILKA